MTENETRDPKDVLNEIYANLQSGDDVIVLQAIDALSKLNFSSEAVRRQLEKISVQSGNGDIRRDALAALALPAQRAVSGRVSKMNRGNRFVVLQEINDWEKEGLLDNHQAEVIRRRYDFDFTPQARRKRILNPKRISLKQEQLPR